MKNRNVILIIFIFFTALIIVKGQSTEKIKWITFNQLNDSLKIKTKKVFVNFHAEWCKYCKEMERTTFQNPSIIKELNENYYAVQMDVESKEVIKFGNQTFVNKRIRKVNPVHEIALLLASRKDKAFSLPAYVLFDEKFEATARYFQFLDADALLKILKKNDIEQ